MNTPFFTTVTRIADVETNGFEVAPLPHDDWATGDYVICEVQGRPGPLYQIERPSGRMCQVFDGDHVVGALGTRAATLEGVGGWRDVDADGAMHALTGAGLFGKATSVSPLLPPLMRLQYGGHLMREGGKLTMRGFCAEVAPLALDMPVILLIGTSMSAGKTASGRVIVHELAQMGLKVAAAKLTGAARFRDMLSWKDAGAADVFDFVDVGLPSTVCPPEDFGPLLTELLSKIAATGADVLVAEAGASPLEPYNGSVAMQMIDDKVRMMVL
ncbi:MAG: hypothetical protein QNJ16_16125, partial [Rhodobacter sp.]|nr:hypothetical protein [Rhodobacter sp.]